MNVSTLPGKIQVITDNGLPPAGGFEAQDAFSKGGDVWKNYCATHGRRQGYLAHDQGAGVSIYTPIALPEGFDAFLARFHAARTQGQQSPVARPEPKLVLVDARDVVRMQWYERFCPRCSRHIGGLSAGDVETNLGRLWLIKCTCGALLEKD